METDYVKALETASWYFDLRRRGMKHSKPEAVKELAAFGLFTPTEVSAVLDVTVDLAKKHMGLHTNMSWPNRIWKTDALHVLWLIAVDWRDNQEVNRPLVQLASSNGTSIKAISQLTGTPLNAVREAVYGTPNLLDLLRAGADSPSD